MIDPIRVERLLDNLDRPGALDELVAVFDPWIRRCARKWGSPLGIADQEDMEQEGRLALLSIAKKVGRSTDIQYQIGYICRSLKYSCRSWISGNRTIRRPHQLKDRRIIERVERLSPAYASLLRNVAVNPPSLDAPIRDSSIPLVDSMPALAPSPEENCILSEIIDLLSASLTPDEWTSVQRLANGEGIRLPFSRIASLNKRISLILGIESAHRIGLIQGNKFCESMPFGYKSNRKPGTVEDMFFSNIKRVDSHWIWTGPRRPKGGGILYLQRGDTKRNFSARHVSFQIHCGEILETESLFVTCGQSFCVSPEHLSTTAPKRGPYRKTLLKAGAPA